MDKQIKLFSKIWAEEEHEKVITCKSFYICLRDFSIHFEQSYFKDAWSLGLGWLQISFAHLSKPKEKKKIIKPPKKAKKKPGKRVKNAKLNKNKKHH